MVNGINVQDVNVMLSLVIVFILWIVTCKRFWNKSKSNSELPAHTLCKVIVRMEANQTKNIQSSTYPYHSFWVQEITNQVFTNFTSVVRNILNRKNVK